MFIIKSVTTSLDTSLQCHAQTLELLSLQRLTYNLPMQLVSPGRTLLRRGALLQLDNSSVLKEREFLLFSDCLIWLANESMIEAEWTRRGGIFHARVPGNNGAGYAEKRPKFKRTRSKSENEIQDLLKPRKVEPPEPTKKPRQLAGYEERWWFKGKVDLVDIDVVLGLARECGDEQRLDILSPDMSFSLYSNTEDDRDEWVSALRGAKASLLVSLNVMNPNSTLASSSATNHIRKSLQALPYLPEEEEDVAHPKRGKVDYFVPAVWVPDGRTLSCMRCGREFGWRRRRHHCRLCGRCICFKCSEKVSYIRD